MAKIDPINFVSQGTLIASAMILCQQTDQTCSNVSSVSNPTLATPTSKLSSECSSPSSIGTGSRSPTVSPSHLPNLLDRTQLRHQNVQAPRPHSWRRTRQDCYRRPFPRGPCQASYRRQETTPRHTSSVDNESKVTLEKHDLLATVMAKEAKNTPEQKETKSRRGNPFNLQIVKANRLANVSGHQTCWTPTALYAQQNWQCCKRKTYVASADLFCIGQSVSLDNLYFNCPRPASRFCTTRPIDARSAK